MANRIKSITYTCKHCGNEYHPKAADRNTYCSRECTFAARAEQAKKQATSKVSICVICGKEFIGRSNKQCCSAECEKTKAKNKANKRDNVFTRETATSARYAERKC